MPSVPNSETGTATLGTNVARGSRRNRENNQDHQRNRDQQRPLDIVQRGADRARPVERHGDINIAGDRGLEIGQHGAHVVDRLDDIGIGLLGDDQHDRRLAVEQALVAQILHRVLHIGHIAQADIRAISIGNQQVAVLLGQLRLIVGVELEMLIPGLDRPLGTVGIGGGESGADIFQPDPVFEQVARV